MPKYSMLDIVGEYRREATQFGDGWDLEISRRLRERTNPTDVLYKAFRLFDSGQTTRADKLLQGWKETFPGDARIYHFMAIANKRRNNPGLVRQYFEEGRRVDPTDTDLLQSFFGFLLENGDKDAALGVMNDIMSMEPNITDYINRAVLRVYLEKPGYLDDFREALRLDPEESQRCISAVASSSIDHNVHLDEMSKVMEICISGKHACTDIYSELAHTYLILGRKNDARRVLDMGIERAQSEEDARVMESVLAAFGRI